MKKLFLLATSMSILFLTGCDPMVRDTYYYDNYSSGYYNNYDYYSRPIIIDNRPHNPNHNGKPPHHGQRPPSNERPPQGQRPPMNKPPHHGQRPLSNERPPQSQRPLMNKPQQARSLNKQHRNETGEIRQVE